MSNNLQYLLKNQSQCLTLFYKVFLTTAFYTGERGKDTNSNENTKKIHT